MASRFFRPQLSMRRRLVFRYGLVGPTSGQNLRVTFGVAREEQRELNSTDEGLLFEARDSDEALYLLKFDWRARNSGPKSVGLK
jgi:hypothetical protein